MQHRLADPRQQTNRSPPSGSVPRSGAVSSPTEAVATEAQALVSRKTEASMLRSTLPALPRVSMLALTLAGCSQPPARSPSRSFSGSITTPAAEPPTIEKQAPALPPLDSDVVLVLEVDTSSGPRSPTLVGRTNLPNGTSMMAEVEGGPTQDWLGQDKVVVANGMFRAGCQRRLKMPQKRRLKMPHSVGGDEA